jgi:hypothetical protein
VRQVEPELGLAAGELGQDEAPAALRHLPEAHGRAGHRGKEQAASVPRAELTAGGLAQEKNSRSCLPAAHSGLLAGPGGRSWSRGGQRYRSSRRGKVIGGNKSECPSKRSSTSVMTKAIGLRRCAGAVPLG